MTPSELRDANFNQLAESLPGIRRAVWLAWCSVKSGTTRELAGISRIDLLTFRPRTTELYEIGLVEFVCQKKKLHGGSEGIYRARTDREWEEWRKSRLVNADSQQFLRFNFNP